MKKTVFTVLVLALLGGTSVQADMLKGTDKITKLNFDTLIPGKDRQKIREALGGEDQYKNKTWDDLIAEISPTTTLEQLEQLKELRKPLADARIAYLSLKTKMDDTNNIRQEKKKAEEELINVIKDKKMVLDSGTETISYKANKTKEKEEKILKDLEQKKEEQSKLDLLLKNEADEKAKDTLDKISKEHPNLEQDIELKTKAINE